MEAYSASGAAVEHQLEFGAWRQAAQTLQLEFAAPRQHGRVPHLLEFGEPCQRLLGFAGRQRLPGFVVRQPLLGFVVRQHLPLLRAPCQLSAFGGRHRHLLGCGARYWHQTGFGARHLEFGAQHSR